MSLMKTLAKVAVGVALAKGASSVMGGKSGGGSGGGLAGMLGGLAGGGAQQGGGGLGGMLGALQGGGAQQSGGGGLESMLGGLMGGGSAGGGSAGGGLGQGGLGGLLEQLGGAGQSGGGGLQSMLGGLAGGGGMAGLMGGLAGSMASKPQTAADSFGAVLNSQFAETPEPALTPSAEQEAAAALMLRAMIQATKADGELDDAEQAKLLEHLGGDVDREEAEFLQSELKRPVDVDGLVQDTPKGLEPQIYAMSILGIDLDSKAEAQYLHGLAQAYGMDAKAVNGIHEQLGVPALYT